jgi:hypothetical protein
MPDRARARPDLILLVVLLILEFSASLLHGYKTTFILPKLLVVVFIYAQFRGRTPIKWVFVFVVAILLTFPVVEQYRILSGEPGAAKDAGALVVGGVGATVQDIDRSTALSVEKLTKRMRQIENVAVVLRDTPRPFPHTNGRALPEAVVIALVPRVLWPDKPILDAATTFPQLYLGQAADSRSGTGPSHFGDLYRNFGLVGVLLGMGVLGAVFAALGRLADRGGLRTLLILAFTLTVLTRIEDSLAEGIVAFSRTMPPVVLCALLLPRLLPGRESEGKPTPA